MNPAECLGKTVAGYLERIKGQDPLESWVKDKFEILGTENCITVRKTAEAIGGRRISSKF